MKKTTILIISVLVIIAIIVGVVIAIQSSKKDNTENNKEVKLQTADDMINMLNTIYSKDTIQLPELETAVIDVTDEVQVTTYTGLQSNENVEELVVSVPFINAQAYSVAVVKVKENADIEKMKQEMLDNIDMRRWICVSAETVYITNYENVIFLVMSSEEWAKPVYDEFKNFVGNRVGKELEKAEDAGFDIPDDEGVIVPE